MTKENSYLQQAEDKTAKRPYFAWQQKSRLSQRSILNVRASNNFSNVVGKGPGDKAVRRDTAAKMSLIFNIRELKQLGRRRQRRLQKTIGLINDQNNSSARASRFLIHIFDVSCTTTTWNLLICRFMENVNIQCNDEFSFLFLNLNKILKNSTPWKVACIWHFERVQIDASKFERTQIHFFTVKIMKNR